MRRRFTRASSPRVSGPRRRIRLKAATTIVLVTHQLLQARRVADQVACICLKDGAGELTEADRCDVIFDSPSRSETREYLGVPPLPGRPDDGFAVN